MGISDLIAEFIREALEESENGAELRRAEIANQFGCVPSQINYVIQTRFSPERGYIVSSRRGGGGYIHIRRVQAEPKKLLMHTVNAIGETIDAQTAGAFLQNLLDADTITKKEANIMAAALGGRALSAAPVGVQGKLRAGILKQMLLQTQ